MKEKSISEYTRILEFESGESIKITIQMVNIDANKNLSIKDFLEPMLKEIKKLF